MAKIKIGGIVKNTELSMIGVVCISGRPGTAGRIMQSLNRAGINIQFIVQLPDAEGHDHVAFCVAEREADRTLGLLENVKEEIGAQALIQSERVATISVFGPDFRERPGIAGAMFSALGAHCINIRAISTSISTLSCVIAADDLDAAAIVVSEAFALPGRRPSHIT